MLLKKFISKTPCGEATPPPLFQIELRKESAWHRKVKDKRAYPGMGVRFGLRAAGGMKGAVPKVQRPRDILDMLLPLDFHVMNCLPCPLKVSIYSYCFSWPASKLVSRFPSSNG